MFLQDGVGEVFRTAAEPTASSDPAKWEADVVVSGLDCGCATWQSGRRQVRDAGAGLDGDKGDFFALSETRGAEARAGRSGIR